MNLFPTEILLQIFSLCSEADTFAPGKLSIVAFRWRNIIHNSPRLWTNLASKPPFSHAQWSQQTSIYLSRSHPLQISINLEFEEAKQSHILLLLAPLLLYRSRWQCLTIRGMDLDLTVQIGSEQDPSRLMLVWDCLISRTEFMNTLIGGSVNAPSVSTSVERFPVYHTPLPFEGVNIIDRNWETDKDCNPIDGILGLLSCCRRLCTLKFFGISAGLKYRYLYPPRQEPLLLPHLTNLALGRSYLAHPILLSLSLPALKDLTLFGLGTGDDMSVLPRALWDGVDDGDPSGTPVSDRLVGHAVCTLVDQSPGMQLQTLRMHNTDVKTKDYCFLFGRMNELEELHLHASDISDTAMGLLSSPECLPKLHTIKFSMCRYVTGSALVRALVGRERLRRIEVLSCSRVGPIHENELRDVFGDRLVTI